MEPRIVVVVYKPRPGRAKDLERVVSRHLVVLSSEKLVTDRKPVVMRAKNGAIIEIFEWISSQAIESAHKNPKVLNLWDEFNEVCEYDTPINIEEFHNLFSEFEPVNFN